jgi:acyl carrier protein
MDKQSIEKRVIGIIVEQFAVSAEKVTRESVFQQDLYADSLDMVNLDMELEEEFDISIPDDVSEKFLTVGDVIDWLASNVPSD